MIFEQDDPDVPKNVLRGCLDTQEKRKLKLYILRFFDKNKSWCVHIIPNLATHQNRLGNFFLVVAFYCWERTQVSINLSFPDSSSNFVQMWMRICKPNNDGRVRMYEEIVVMLTSEPDVILFSIIIKCLL